MRCPVCDGEVEKLDVDDKGTQVFYTYACNECENELVYILEMEMVDGKRTIIEEHWEEEDDLAELSCDYLEGRI